MEVSIQLHAIKLEWSIVYIEGQQTIISKHNVFLVSLDINFVLAYSADLDEICGISSGSSLFVNTHLGVSSLQRVKKLDINNQSFYIFILQYQCYHLFINI